MNVSAANRFAFVLALAAVLGGCGIHWHDPPPTPLEASWTRYQACVHQSKNATVQCERLKLAYEAQLNRMR